MSSRGSASPLRTGRPVAVLAALWTLGLTLGMASLGAVAAPASAQPSAAAPADSRTIADPKSDIKVTVTPSDLSTLAQGDTVHLHVEGLKASTNDPFDTTTGTVQIGTCPGPSAVPDMSDVPADRHSPDLLDPSSFSVLCNSQFATGLPGGIDANGVSTGVSGFGVSLAPRTDGTLDFDFRVGEGLEQGTVTPRVVYNNTIKHLPSNLPQLQCDPTHECTIGFAAIRLDGSYFHDIKDLTFSPATRAAGSAGACSGLGAATITAQGPERMQFPLAALDSAYCATTTSAIPVSYVASPVGEGGVIGAATVGTTSDLGFIGSPAMVTDPLRSGQVAVPIALNAVSVAQIGGKSLASLISRVQAYNFHPYTPMNLQPSDVARLVLHDMPVNALPDPFATPPFYGASYNPLSVSIQSRPGNAAQLGDADPSFQAIPWTMAPTPTYGVGTSSLATVLSDYLRAQAGTSWTYPRNSINDAAVNGARSGKAVGDVTSFDAIVDQDANGSQLTSQFSSINSMYNVIALKDNKLFDPAGQSGISRACPFANPDAPVKIVLAKGCLRFAVLDSASTTSLGLVSAALGTGTQASAYVAPTVASMGMAATGTLNAKGYFSSTDSAAYPMTFVEYAVVPTTPLLDDSCHPRTAQQAMLKSFLGYVTSTAGQASLAAGLAPLPATLQAQAATAIAKIGTATPTGACAPKKPTPTPTTTSTPSTSDTGSADLTGGGSSSSGGGSGQATTPTAASTDGASTDALRSNAAERPSSTVQAIAYEPTFSGATRTSTVSSFVGLGFLLVLVALGAAWGAGTLSLPGVGRRGGPASGGSAS